MMLTKEQAAEAWCPMQGAASEGERGFTVIRGIKVRTMVPSNAQAGHCIADHCAMWRWDGKPEDFVDGVPRGYCGLAGRPA